MGAVVKLNSDNEDSHTPLTDEEIAKKEADIKASADMDAKANELKLGYQQYMIAKACSSDGVDFTPTDMTALTANLKEISEKSGVPKAIRDEKWDQVRQGLAIQDIHTDQCHAAKKYFADDLPDGNKVNPF